MLTLFNTLMVIWISILVGFGLRVGWSMYPFIEWLIIDIAVGKPLLAVGKWLNRRFYKGAV